MITISELFNKCSLLVCYVVSCFLSAMPERCVDGLPKRLKNHDKTPSENRFFRVGGRLVANSRMVSDLYIILIIRGLSF